jgi:WD40 repeat protein
MFGVAGDGQIHVFDGIQETPVRAIEVKEPIMALGLSPNADYVLCGTTEIDDFGCIDMYKFDTGEFLQRFEGNDGCVYSFCFLESGYFVSGSSGRELRIWDPNTGECVRVMNDTVAIWGMSTLIDGFRIIANSIDENEWHPRIWNTRTFEFEAVLNDVESFRVRVCNTTGLIAILDQDSSVHVYSSDATACLQMIFLLPELDPHSLCFSFDGLSIICGNKRGITKITIAESEFSAENIEYWTDMENDVMALPDGRILAFDCNSIVLTEVKPSTGILENTSLRREFKGNMSDLFLIPESPILL